MKMLTVLYNRVLFDSVSGCGNALIADTNKMGASSTNIFTSEEKEKKTKKKGEYFNNLIFISRTRSAFFGK